MSLPSSRTLRDYTHVMASGTGFQADVTEQLLKEVKYDTIEDFQKHVAVVFDEVRIKDRLVFDKHGLKVIGFIDVGDVNNELLQFERSFQSSENARSFQSSENARLQERVAKYMLVFMVRGIFINLKFPFAQFATRNLSADLLVWGTIQKLEAADLKVMSVTCVMEPHPTENLSVCINSKWMHVVIKPTTLLQTKSDTFIFFLMSHI